MVRCGRTTPRVRGAALVEFALVFPLLMFILLGIIEFGMLALHKLTLEEVAREGARVAAVGRPTAEITARIHNAAGALPNQSALQISLWYSTDNGQTYPNALADTPGGENTAPPGSLIQARLQWSHTLVTGSFFAWLTSAKNNAVPVQAQVVMRRE